MKEDRAMLVARVSAEMCTSATLTDVSEWVIARQHNHLRVHANHLPALGRHTWLRMARPIMAPRALLCTLWLLEDADGGACLVAGTLRFVSHPQGSDVRLSFEGLAVRTARGDAAAVQLLHLLASSIAPRDASQTQPAGAAG
jgi:hypothetical protein